MARAVRLAVVAALALLAAPGGASPDAASAAMAKARAALARGDGIAAQTELERAQAAGLSREALAAPMGEALIIQHDLTGARGWLAPARFTPDSAAYGWRMLGMLERFSGNMDAAGSAYAKGLALAPKDPLLLIDAGRLHYGQGDQAGAIDLANRALLADPDSPRALEFRAQLLRDSAGWAAALPLYERALLHAPNDMALLAGYAATLGEADRAREMLVVTRHMIGIDPADPQAWYLQAVLAARAGNFDLARRLIIKTGTRMNDVPAAMLLRGSLELEAGNANAAIAQLDRLASMQPANQVVQALLARALTLAGDNQGIVARFWPACTRPGASPYLLTIVARALEERGDRLGAAALLDRAAAGEATPVTPIFERGSDAAAAVRGQIASGNFGGASATAAGYLAQRPGSFEGQSLLGDARLAQGNAADAMRNYGAAAQIRFPERIMLRTVEALERSGQGRTAPGFVLGYLNAFPGSGLAARLSAGHAAYAGDWAHARSMLEWLRDRSADRDARVLSDLSLAQLRSGDVDVAADTAERAAALAPASGYAAQAWALALAEADRDPDLARQLLAKAQRIGGDNPMLAAARKKLSQ